MAHTCAQALDRIQAVADVADRELTLRFRNPELTPEVTDAMLTSAPCAS